MDISLARTVLRGTFRSADELQRLLPELKEGCAPEEYATYLKAIGTVLADMTLEITNRVIAAHPELEAEVEKSVRSSGKY